MAQTRRRLLVLGLYYAPETTGSAPYTTAMCAHFAAQGHDVTVVTGVPHYPQWKVADGYDRMRAVEEIDGVTVVRLRHYVPGTQSAVTRGVYEASWLTPASVEVLRHRADVVLSMSPPLAALPLGRLAARRNGVPWGIVLQDFMGKGAAQAGTSGGAQVAAVVDRIESAHLRKADRVGVIGPGFRDAVASMGVAPDRIDLLPNWTHVEASPLSRDEARRRLGWPLDRFLVVHTGNMGAKQGLDNVVAAAGEADRREAHVSFVLVGDGNQRPTLVAQANGVSRIQFLPPVDAEDYAHVLAAADVLLVNERPGMVEMSLPSKVTSYLVAGRPVLAAVPLEGGTARMLADTGAARIVAAGDPSALVDAALALASDGAAREELGRHATRHAKEELGEEPALARYDAFLDRLLRTRR